MSKVPTAADERAMERCGVCLQPYRRTGTHTSVKLQCGHVLGRVCMLDWFTIQQVCPFCSRSVRLEDITLQTTSPEYLLKMMRQIITGVWSGIASAEKWVDYTKEVLSDTQRSVKMMYRTKKCPVMWRDALCDIELAEKVLPVFQTKLGGSKLSMESIKHIVDDARKDMATLIKRYRKTRMHICGEKCLKVMTFR